MPYFLPCFAMQQSQKKASEVATALIKISVYVRRSEMRRRLERLAFRLVEDISCASPEETNKTLDAIEGFMHLGRHLYEVEPMNAEIILREIAYLRSVVEDADRTVVRAIPPPGEIEAIFAPEQKEAPIPREGAIRPGKPGKRKGKPVGPNPGEKVNSLLDEAADENNAATDEAGANVAMEMRQNNLATDNKAAIEENQAIRQSEIFEKMRQLPDQKMQLKDIIAAFPDVSERTIRYDLQRLCSQGLLERVGPGGPGTHYRIRVV